MKKRIVSVILLLCMLNCIFPVSADGFDVTVGGKTYRRSVDVPAIYISDAYGVRVEDYVPCTVVAIDRKGGSFPEVYDNDATIRIRGNSTSSGEKKPYNIKFSSKTDLFGMGKGKRYCLIANLYDPTLIRNHTVFDFASRIGMRYTPDSMLVDVYFNGTYVGCYQLCEALTDDKARVDINCDAGEFLLERDQRTDRGTTYFTSGLGIRFGINEPQEVTSSQLSDIRSKVSRAEAALRSRDFEQVKKYFDIPSMVDFYICMEYFKNVDIDCASTRFYYKDGKFHGGPVWDFDLSSGNCSSSYYTNYYRYGDCAAGIWCDCLWFSNLLGYEEFRDALYTRYLELQDTIVNLYQDNCLGKCRIDRIVSSAGKSITRNRVDAGWYPDYMYAIYMRRPESNYVQNLEVFRDWLRRRNEWLLKYWDLNDRLYPTPTDSYLSVRDGFLLGFAPETPVYELPMMLDGTVTCDADGAYIYTGCHIRGEGASLTAVVAGDLTCDGLVSVQDYFLLKRHLYRNSTLSPSAYQAACMGNTAPDASCAKRIRAFCLR